MLWIGTDIGVVGRSRCFSAGSGVGDRSSATCLNPPCFSWVSIGVGIVAAIETGGVGGSADCGCGCVVPRESMPLRRSFEKNVVRFVGACTAERGEPSGMLLGGRDSGDDGVFAGVGVVGRGDMGAEATRLSATSVSRTAVGVPGAFSTENFS